VEHPHKSCCVHSGAIIPPAEVAATIPLRNKWLNHSR
jgi:hypothetical protein